jgi:hypothetical protein
MNYNGYKEIIPSKETIERWMYTRKLAAHDYFVVGDFKFPGFFTTQGLKTDRLLFWIAFIIEVGFLGLVSYLVGGFDLLLSLGALGTVVVDVIGALMHRTKQNEICKAQLELSVLEYGLKTNQGPLKGDIDKQEEYLKVLKGNFWRGLSKFIIIFSALVKIAGLAVILWIPSLTIAMVLLFSAVAYVHINHTGFYISAWRFKSSLKADYAKQISKRANNKDRNTEADYTPREIEGILSGVSLREIKKAVYSEHGISDSIIKVKDGEQTKWHYRLWKHHFWDDQDLKEFVVSTDSESHPLSEAAKAFILANYCEDIYLGAAGNFH